MGWFENQIEERRAADQQILEESFVKIASVVLGQRTANKISDERIVTKNAIDEILKYYHFKPTELPEGIKMIKVHSFETAAFGQYDFLNGDIYIVRESEAASLSDSFKDIEGIKVYDAASGTGAAESFIRYTADGVPEEDYYLFYGINSMHAGDRDIAAIEAAGHFLKIR